MRGLPRRIARITYTEASFTQEEFERGCKGYVQHLYFYNDDPVEFQKRITAAWRQSATLELFECSYTLDKELNSSHKPGIWDLVSDMSCEILL